MNACWKLFRVTPLILVIVSATVVVLFVVVDIDLLTEVQRTQKLRFPELKI